jgi:phosphate/sulfate permease
MGLVVGFADLAGAVEVQAGGSSLLVAVAVVAGLGMAWALGASSNSPPFAPAVGANALPTMRAAFFVGIFAGLGAITQGGSISETVGNDLIRGSRSRLWPPRPGC